MTRLFGVRQERFALNEARRLSDSSAIAARRWWLCDRLRRLRPGACSSTGAKQVFSPWGDQRNYVLAPDGGFEAGAQGWALAGGARPVAGNESYYLNAAGDRSSLSLPAGSSAGSPPVCMAIDTPSFRMMARNTGDPQLAAAGDGQLQAARPAPHADARHRHRRPQLGADRPQSTVLTLSTIVGTLIPSAIEIRITPLDSKGSWQVDDLYIDPFARR